MASTIRTTGRSSREQRLGWTSVWHWAGVLLVVLALLAPPVLGSHVTRVATEGYVGGFTYTSTAAFDCVGIDVPNAGGACFDIQPGEVTLDVELTDLSEPHTTLPPAAVVAFLPAQPGEAGVPVCGSEAGIPIPAGKTQVVVQVAEPSFGALVCLVDGKEGGLATAGTIEATFHEGHA